MKASFRQDVHSSVIGHPPLLVTCHANDCSTLRCLLQVIFPMEDPNGIALSPDGRTLYVAETPTGRLYSYSVQGPGKLAGAPGRPRATLVYSAPER